MVLLLIGGVPVIIILAATWLWYFGASGQLDVVNLLGTANNGSLVQPPRQIDDVQIQDAQAETVVYSALEPRWTMLVPVAGAECGEACEKNLYLTRQIRTAMGKEFNRLQRMVVGEVKGEVTADRAVADIVLTVDVLSDDRPAPAGFTQYLESEHSGLRAWHIGSDDFGVLFPELETNISTWYLVDPTGWVMMSYNSDISYKEVITDLKFLLKNSGG